MSFKKPLLGCFIKCIVWVHSEALCIGAMSRSRKRLYDALVLGLNNHLKEDGGQFTKHLLLWIEWNIHICTEKLILANPLGWGWGSTKMFVRNWMTCTELQHEVRVVWEVNLQKQSLLGMAWNVWIYMEKSLLPTPIPHGGGESRCFLLGIQWNVEICTWVMTANSDPLCSWEGSDTQFRNKIFLCKSEHSIQFLTNIVYKMTTLLPPHEVWDMAKHGLLFICWHFMQFLFC